ncbi:MAG: glycine zipper family protein [Candidatus Marinimicrobia bacterium]|jgi:hypothetical protein|nr:glycine zipper family protein [Candidatus Neomarinimicrobiota bacterium]|tara:strand:- start:498 stop:668 length:171 start_codon:yes stop_codon:yes gene_type:complete
MKNIIEDRQSKFIGIGLTLGIAIGAAMDNVGLGIALGLAIGAGIGSYKKPTEIKIK